LKYKLFSYFLCFIVLLSFMSCGPPNPIFKSINTKLINAKIYTQYNASVSITDSSRKIYGSGVVVKKGKDIFVLTAAHVIEHMQKKKIDLYILPSFNASLVRVKIAKLNSLTDLAKLNIQEDKKKFKWFVKLAKSPPLIGDTVWMISSPKGDANLVTKGIVSKHLAFFKKKHKKYIVVTSITASGFFGSSGGGVFNDHGELIGIFHMISHIFGYGKLPGGNYAVSLLHLKEFLK